MKSITKAPEKPKSVKLSKAGLAMKAGILKGSIIEITEDPWNLKK